jgi:hypothetical protein
MTGVEVMTESKHQETHIHNTGVGAAGLLGLAIAGTLIIWGSEQQATVNLARPGLWAEMIERKAASPPQPGPTRIVYVQVAAPARPAVYRRAPAAVHKPPATCVCGKKP